MSQTKTEIIDLTFLGTDNHRTTHRHLLTFSYQNLKQNLMNPSNFIDEPFIENSPIQIRLFDGIGCQGTTENPRPGNYTWDKENFESKTINKTNEKITHHVAKATGEGMQALLDEADDYIEFIIKKNNNNPPKTINLKGYSRGADACIRLVNRIYEKHPQIKINLFLVDPVPGPFHRDDDGSYIIPGNVERFDVTFMKDEKIPFFKPQHMGRLVIQNPFTTQVHEHYLAGVHGEALYIDKGLEENDQIRESHEKTKKNLIQFIFDTTTKLIELPTCYRDRTKSAKEQFTHDDTTPSPSQISSEDDDEVVDLTQITDEERNSFNEGVDEKRDENPYQKKQDNQSDLIQSQTKSIKDKKTLFLNFKAIFHHRRTLVREEHDQLAVQYQNTQSEELKFYIKQFRDAQNFYHYHYPYHQKKTTTFETLKNSLLRIKEILLGKTMEEKTKIWPDHYATLLIQEALEYPSEKDLAFALENNEEFKQQVAQFIRTLQVDLDSIQKKQIRDNPNTYTQFQQAKKLFHELKEKKTHDPIENKLFTHAVGNLNDQTTTSLEPSSDDIEKNISRLKEGLQLQRFKDTTEKIQKLPNSKFFKKNLQSYEEYQKKFIEEIEKLSIYVHHTQSLSPNKKYNKAKQQLLNLIKTNEPEKLHELYAIGQAPYLKDLLAHPQDRLSQNLGPRR